MKKTKIYGLMLLGFGMSITACSNLDESKAIINTTENNIIYSETFASGLGQFKAKSISGDQVWAENSNGYAMMSGYVSPANFANEDWLISPEIDLSKVTTANMSFDHCTRYFANVTNEATVWVSENYVNDSSPTTATWTQILTNPFSDPGSWTFGSSGQISLTKYAGKKITIAFKYISTATKAGTWEMKNFLISKGEAVAAHSLILAEPFAGSLGNFTNQSILGSQVWGYDSHGYAMMSGYVSPSNFANEDWLISPEIDLTNYTAANFSFDHVTRYFGNLATEATVWISKNYVSGLPSSATWTQVSTNPFFDPGSYTFSNSQAISLTAYAGNKIHIAFKYLSTATKAGTWELKNFQVFSGEANGIESLPFTVAQAINSQQSALGWVQGYVVGYSWPFQSQYAYYFTPDTCSQVINILMADTTAGLYITKCLAVQLPRGGIRNGLNLKSNKTLFGQIIKVYGTLSPNFGLAGLINPQKYILANGATGVSTTVNFFSETFASSLGSFTKNNVLGVQVWAWSSGYGAAMSGFSGTNIPNEDWLISPAIDLTNFSSAALTFDHTINKGVLANLKTDQTLWITSDNGTTWKQLTIPTYPTGNNWTYVNSGEINLDAFVGKTVKIAFKYLSSTASSSTWEIKNFLIYY
jgi:ribulose bisphosphate carboxylase small subunit